MSEGNKQPGRFQLHKTTEILVFLAAGGMLWAQLHRDYIEAGMYRQGCPCGITIQGGEAVVRGEGDLWIAFVLNAVVCLGLLICIALLSKTLILYREIRNSR